MEALLLPRTESGFVDLGSFQELLFDHDLSRTLAIRLDIRLDRAVRDKVNLPQFLRHNNSFGIEISLSRKTPQDEITLEGYQLCGEDPTSYIAKFENASIPKDFPKDFWRYYAAISYRSGRRRRTGSLRAARCTDIRDEPDFWNPAHEWTSRERTTLLSRLKNFEEIIQSSKGSQVRSLFEDEDENGESRSKARQKLDEAVEFLSSEFSHSAFVQWMVSQQLGTFVGLDGFIPIMSGQPDFGLPPIRRDWTTDVGYVSMLVGRMLEQTLSSLFPLGPFRKPPSRWYIFTGTTPQDVGYEGHLLPDLLFRQEELRENTNEWLQRLDIGYHLRIRPLGNDSADLFELRLADQRRSSQVEVGLSDVGFGISQILPLVVQSLAASDQIISVEQPEVHIHPRLQADLGDLFVEAIREPRRNQFIIETHSEHLALRLQRRVREKRLSPDDISIVYVSRGPEGAEVQPLRIDEGGDFMDDFPGGFFPERLRELR